MNANHYPLFIPPEPMATKPHRDWSKNEAQLYSDWLMESIDERVEALLKFFGISESAMRSPRSLLLHLGERVAETLEDPDYSGVTADGKRVLTNHGHALAADMGLLIAKLLRNTVGDALRWTIVRKPKRHVSYNSPVLVGFGADWDTYDPIGVSIANAHSILVSRRSPDVWVTVFDSCVSDAKTKR